MRERERGALLKNLKHKIRKIISQFFLIFNLKIINLKSREIYNTKNTIKYLISRIIKKNIIIVDVGANIGEFANNLNNLCENLNKTSTIHLFEPNKNLYLKLTNNLNFKNKFINMYGLGAKVEKSFFYIHEKDTKSSFLKVHKNYFLDNKKYKIFKSFSKIDTLDNYVKKNKLKAIDFLKIDTQGFNEEVIKGAKNSLKKNIIKIIYTEITLGEKYSKSENFINFENYLIKNNYRLFGIDVGNNFVQVPSIRYSRQLNIDVFYISSSIILN